MAITIGYEDPAALGLAAYQTGLGQFAQYQQQQALREQEMALRERQFASDQEQQNFRNQFAVQQAQLDQYNRNRALGLDYLQNQQQLGLRRDALAQDAATRAAYNQTQLAEAAMRQQSEQQKQQMLMSREQAQIMAQADRQRMQEQARIAAADWEALQKARADGRTFMNESEYLAAVDRWQQKHGGLGERMPLPYVEEPSHNPLQGFLQSMFGEDVQLPIDPNTGELLMEPRDIAQFYQMKVQREAAAEKARIDAQKAQQDAMAAELDKGFEMANQQQKAIEQAANSGDTLANTMVGKYITAQQNPPEDGTSVIKPKFPPGQTVSREVFLMLLKGKFIEPGTAVNIAGHGWVDWNK